MKRLAVIGIRGFPGVQGGVESHCLNIVTYLARHYRCRVYRRRPYLTAQSGTKQFPGIEFKDLPSTQIKGFEALWHTLLCSLHLLLHRADIVNIHNIGPGLFTPLLRLFGMKVVLTYHSANYEHKKWGMVAKTILRIGEFLSLRFASKVIFVNKFQMEKFSERIRRKSVYIPNGISDVTPLTSATFLKKNNLEPGKYILAVGRITPEKGFDTLIRAVNMLPHDCRLAIAGSADHDSSYLDYLKSLDTHKRVTFTGYTTGQDLAELYSHARLYVLSSTNEGFPIVMLEAMSYSLPLVVTDIPATRLVNLKQECYVPVSSPDAMAKAIERELSSAPCRIEYKMDEYRWTHVAQATVDLYKSLD